MTALAWRKAGVIFQAPGDSSWMHSHPSIPTPVALNEELIRVYFSSRDPKGVGRVGFFDVAAADPTKVLNVSREPCLDVGQPGTFDDNGVAACSVVLTPDNRWFMYYVGFELGHRIRYRIMTGLAVSKDGIHFERIRRTPVLDRSDDELYFRGGPFAIYDRGRFRLWYVAGSEWLTINGKPMPVYELRYAESENGIDWPSRGETCLPISQDDEHGFGRPYVFPEVDGYRLFYSVRRKSFQAYRMGMAVSEDCRNWTRADDQIGLDVTPGGFDSEAICYGAPIRAGGRTIMFYNGNGFGETGIGLAFLEG